LREGKEYFLLPGERNRVTDEPQAGPVGKERGKEEKDQKPISFKKGGGIGT